MNRLPREVRLGLAFIAIGLLLLLLAALVGDAGFYPTYLAAYLFWLGLSLGPLALYMIGHVSGGRWGRISQIPFLAAGGVLPVMVLLFIPLIIGMPVLYSWFPDAGFYGEKIANKAPYLNSGFFVVRAVVYFTVWIGLVQLLIRSARRGRHTAGGRRLSALGLVLYALTGTLAITDWVMSLLPSWYSTVFGVEVLTAQLLQGICLGVLVTDTRLHAVSADDRHDLGNLMLVFTMLWAYLAFSDFLTIWIADLPRETLWYRLRFEGFWHWSGPTLIMLLFVIPCASLLFRALKRDRFWLAALALLILAGTLLYSFWLTVPSLSATRIYTPDWLSVVLPIALGAVWIGVFQLRLLQLRTLASKDETCHG
jgi:hypothetical protein